MRFLVEILHSTLVPHVIEADSEEEALAILRGSEVEKCNPGTLNPSPPSLSGQRFWASRCPRPPCSGFLLVVTKWRSKKAASSSLLPVESMHLQNG